MLSLIKIKDSLLLMFMLLSEQARVVRAGDLVPAGTMLVTPELDNVSKRFRVKFTVLY